MRWNLKQDQENYDQQPYVLYVDDHDSSVDDSVYPQDEYTIRRNVILSAGARFDHYSGLGNSAKPRVGLIYRPWERTTLKFLYGQAFRVPSLYEPLAFLLEPARPVDRTVIRDVCRITHQNDEAYAGALAVVVAIRSVLSGTWTQEKSFRRGRRFSSWFSSARSGTSARTWTGSGAQDQGCEAGAAVDGSLRGTRPRTIT